MMSKEQANNNMTARSTTLSWLWLMFLSVLSVMAGLYLHSSAYFIAIVFCIVFFKGQQVTDVFMELKHAPKLWRYLLLGYVFVLAVVLSFIYLI